LGPPT
jgi:NAD(P)-dependent dehydrogenase (short-subunit alcohol dehydrogenase family)